MNPSSTDPGPEASPPVARLPFFYGWVIAGVIMASSALGAGLNNVSLGVILRPLSDDLGWSRSLTAGAIGAGTVAAGLIAPLMGGLADRFGPRVLLPTGAAIGGLFVYLMSRAVEPWQFYATYIPARAFAEPMLVSIVPLTAIANWFHRRRPRVMGLAAMSVPLGSAVLVLWYQLLIAHFGWRSTFVSLAVLFWIVLVIPGALILRRHPEDLGLWPDGVSSDSDSASPAYSTGRGRVTAPAEPLSWTLREALRTRAFWFLAGSNMVASLATGGTAFNMVAYFTDAHIDPGVAAGALSLFALSGGIGAGALGLLAERVSARWLNVGALAIAASAMLVLLAVRSAPLAYCFALLFGLSARGQGVLVQVQLANYFGRRSYGAISGVANPFLLGGLGLGPFLAALTFDLTGTYAGVFGAFSALFFAAAVLTSFARRPIRVPPIVAPVRPAAHQST